MEPGDWTLIHWIGSSQGRSRGKRQGGSHGECHGRRRNDRGGPVRQRSQPVFTLQYSLLAAQDAAAPHQEEPLPQRQRALGVGRRFVVVGGGGSRGGGRGQGDDDGGGAGPVRGSRGGQRRCGRRRFGGDGHGDVAETRLLDVALSLRVHGVRPPLPHLRQRLPAPAPRPRLGPEDHLLASAPPDRPQDQDADHLLPDDDAGQEPVRRRRPQRGRGVAHLRQNRRRQPTPLFGRQVAAHPAPVGPSDRESNFFFD